MINSKNSAKKITLFSSLREAFILSIKLSIKSVSSSIFLPKLSRFINKHLYRFGIGSAINRYDNSLTFYSAKADKKLYTQYNKNDIFCNFGSGAFFHKNWENFDYPGQSNYYKSIQGRKNADFHPIDLCVDNLVLPYNKDSVSLIYFSHTLEHLEENAALRFLSECHRILKPNGIIRIVIPSTDNDHEIMSILDKQKLAIETKIDFACQVAQHVFSDTDTIPQNHTYKMMIQSNFDAKKFFEIAVNNGCKTTFDGNNPDRHISFWDYKKLSAVSKQLRFSQCIPFYRGSSMAKPFLNLNVFDTTENQISLYVELIK